MKILNPPTEPIQTLQFVSDGLFVYWLFALKAHETVPHPVTGEKMKQHSVYLQPLEVKVRIVFNRYGTSKCPDYQGVRVSGLICTVVQHFRGLDLWGVIVLFIFHYISILQKSSDVPSPGTDPPVVAMEMDLVPHGERVYLHRTMVEVDKNSDVVKALMRSNPSYASSAIVSLLGQSKDDTCELVVVDHNLEKRGNFYQTFVLAIKFMLISISKKSIHKL